MAITIKCPDCGHTKQSDDGNEETCPECEGTMVPPAKKKYQAKTKSLEEESRGKKKSKSRDDDEDEKPKKKGKAVEDLPDEDEDEPKPKAKKKSGSGGGGDFQRDPSAAEALELNPGFKNKTLMAQVAEEMSRTEVLHWCGRMCPEIAQRNARVPLFVGIGITCAGLLFSAVFFAVAPWFAGLIPLIFVLVGVGIMIFVPKATIKAAERSWYAVTDQRAIVYAASLFGSGGEATTYEPSELRRMRVKGAKSPEGAGNLIFKTKITEQRTDYVDRKTGRTVRSETSQTTTHYGFLGIENVREVETLIHKVLLKTDDDDE